MPTYIAAITPSALPSQSAAAPLPDSVSDVHPVFPVLGAPKPGSIQAPQQPRGTPIG